MWHKPAGGGTAPMSLGHTPAEISFIIRLWLEARDVPAEPTWRFEVRHVQTGQQVHCRSLVDLLAFIERQAERAGTRGPSTRDYRREEEHR